MCVSEGGCVGSNTVYHKGFLCLLYLCVQEDVIKVCVTEEDSVGFCCVSRKKAVLTVKVSVTVDVCVGSGNVCHRGYLYWLS